MYLAGRRKDVRTQETNLGNLAADADLWLARQVVPDVAVSLKNGGGIRDDIGIVVQPPGTTDPADVQFKPPPADTTAGTREGGISQFDIEGTLRFNNGIVIVPLTAAQFVEIVEHSVANGGDGYPYPMPAPDRIDLSGEAEQPNPPDPDFPDTNGNGVIDEPVLTDPGLATFANPGTEQDSLAEYLAHFHVDTSYNVPETPPLDDERIQNLAIPGKQDTVFSTR